MVVANKKENIYLLTEKGIDLAPLIFEVVIWSDKHVRAYNPRMNQFEHEKLNKDETLLYQFNPKLPHIFLLKRMISSLEILAVAKATSAFSASN